jgi:predicted nucleic acid-binding protein
MKTVFADAFYFVGLLNRADQHHTKVVAAARQLRDDVLTTEWVLAEFADALAESASRRLVPQFIRDLEQDPKVKIIRASTDLFRRGLQLYGERPDKDWSLTDCTSFVTMNDAEIREALTGDQDFEQAGFTALLKS